MAKKPSKKAPKAAPSKPDGRAGNGGKREGSGRKPFEPTAEDRRIVQAAAAWLTHQRIAQLVINPKTGRPIDRDTLEEKFAFELDQGKAKAHFNVGKSLYDQAVGIPELDKNGKQIGWISQPNITAGIWYSKAQMGWREKVTLEVADIEAIVAGLGGNIAALRAARAAVAAAED